MEKNFIKSLLDYVVFSFLFLTAILFVGSQSARYFSAEISADISADISASDGAADYGDAADTVGASGGAEAPKILIDPGHGGEDGGAVGADGTLEKELNLLIAENVRDIFAIFGIRAETTRSGDYMLYDYYNDLDDYTGKMKTYDLRNRLKMAESSGAELYLGIHMNKFPQTQYSGLQVYYSPNNRESAGAAAMIQTYARNYLQPDNTRETKKATSAIYLLNRITIPAVLVECGFLSNEAERALLNTPEYRLRTACAIGAAGMEWLARP